MNKPIETARDVTERSVLTITRSVRKLNYPQVNVKVLEEK